MNWLQKISFPAMNAPMPEISPQEAHDTCIGPFYHGTSSDAVESILNEGFKWEEQETGKPGTSHGYENVPYRNSKQVSCPPPIHHLGFGIYFTQVKSIAKDFGFGSNRNLVEVYILKSANIETINWGSPTTMMKWWNKMGYDCNLAQIDRSAATKALTEKLSSQYDAVLYKGQAMRRLLDGNQICVYNPSILRRVNKKLIKPGEIGSKVKRKSDGMIGIILNRRSLEGFEEIHNGEKEFLSIKWKKGGVDFNVYPSMVDFI